MCNNGHDDDAWYFRGDVTNASDPQGGTTRYCYKDRDLVLDSSDPDDHAPRQRTMDPMKHKRTTSFSPNNDVTTGAGGGDNAATQGTTAYTYNLNNSLKKVTQPKDESGGADGTEGTTTFDYTHANTPAGGSFLPSSVATSSASCSSMAYDTGGKMTDTYTGLAATGADSTCAGDTDGKHSHVDYFSDDNATVEIRNLPHYAYGPEAKGSGAGPDDDWTWYTYFKTGVGTPQGGMLQQVVKPGGNGGAGDAICTTNRTLCTSFTYDSRSRVQHGA